MPDLDLSALVAALPVAWFAYIAIALKGLAIFNGVSSWLAPLLKAKLDPESPLAKAIDVAAATSRKASDSALIAALNKRIGELEAKNYTQEEDLRYAKADAASVRIALNVADERIRDQAALLKKSIQLVEP